MDTEKQARLEPKGWRFGTVSDFLGLTPEEEALVAVRVRVADLLRRRRAQTLVATLARTLNDDPAHAAKSFHLDHYCFDSAPERNIFWQLLWQDRVKVIYFTGMLTHGQSDFFVQYIDPDSHTIRTYYPDFLIQEADGSYTILEVKADFQVDALVVQAKKQFADQMAVASGMRYAILKSYDANAGRIGPVFAH